MSWQRKCALIAAAGSILVSIPTATAGDMIDIPGGRFVMGDAAGDANEVPRTVSVEPFRIGRLEVTNAEYAAFVAATGHASDAERSGAGYVWTDRWRRVAGADWRHPHGPKSTLEGRASHPVVQISQRDAAAYCRWKGLRLPSEAEWEFAARGRDGRRYPWGDAAPRQGPAARANFGTVACCAPDAADGYLRIAPVGRFPAGASPFGALDMAGNVWEWTSSGFPGQPGFVVLRGGGWGNDPYCLRVSYRHANPPDIGLDMVGFRCAGGV
jgi:formylglycine-generating enzyme required for sulfatase activity